MQWQPPKFLLLLSSIRLSALIRPFLCAVCEPQGNGLGGPLAAAALCGLTSLRVLALSQNKLKGKLPQCMASLQLRWLWMDENRFHGPVSQFSGLGQVRASIHTLQFQVPFVRSDSALWFVAPVFEGRRQLEPRFE